MSSSPPSDPSDVFSVRIVSLDYYMAPPILDLDFCYSAFQGRKVEEVPVIRIYGSTPVGQKACLHVHQALPYLYIPYSDDLLPNPKEGHAYLHILSCALEKALSYNSTVSKRQHVHGCSLVRAKKFYGYHPSEELFIKIYLYYPHEVARAAALLLFITDNGSNFKAAGRILEDMHPKMVWTPCAAHCVNLMLQDLGDKLIRIKHVLVEARSLVVYIYNHGRVLNLMRKFTGGKELHRSCVTRFATSYYTLKSIYENKQPLKMMFVSEQWAKSDFAKKVEGQKVEETVAKGDFWENVHFACSILASLVDVIRLVDSEVKPCMGYIYEAMDRAKEQIQKNLDTDQRMCTPVWDIIDKRWNDQLHHPLHAAGFYLNPGIYYKQEKTNIEGNKEIKSGLFKAIDKFVPDDKENDQIIDDLRSYKDALGSFGKPSAIRKRDTMVPTEWWLTYGSDTLMLQKFAIKVLSQTCSASPCERNWSAFDNGGDILNQTFQPYESHIPYLLQFLVDYNLYGMSHLHTSKVKFRPPLPDGVITKEACYKKHDIQADSSSGAVGNPAIWLSSTVPSGLVWSNSATGHDNLEDKSRHLIRRQSICELELDSSVDDILNEKYKMYTSLSQDKSEVKMVQSLIPIWEEYERSGVQEAGKSPDLSKPLPENVLKSFLNRLDYENAFSELCLEEHKPFPSEVPLIEVEKLEKHIKSFTDSNKELMDHRRLSSPCGEHLKCPEEECKTVQLSPGFPTEENEYATPYEKMCKFHGLTFVSKKTTSAKMVGTEDSKSLDNEVLGLLSWLASSQVAEDLSTDDELVHEAILSPLLPTNSYKKALEMAHLDYESASQKECQDILDSVDVLKSEGLKEQASSAESHENMFSVSSVNVIPQVDGSSDDNFRTPKKDGSSDINLHSGIEKSSVHLVGKCTSKRFGGKHKKNKILWGPLPFSNNLMKHNDSESASLNSCDIEMKNDSESSSSSGSKDMSCEVSRLYAGLETSDKKVGKLSACSVRDLMRRKRCFRAEQSECEREGVNGLSEVQENGMFACCPEDPIHHSFEREGPNVMFGDPQQSKASLIDQDGIVLGSTTFPRMRTQGVCTEGYHLGPTNQLLHSNIIPNDHLGSHRESDNGECIDMSLGLPNFAVTSLSLPQVELFKLPEPLMTGHVSTVVCSGFSGCQKDKTPDTSRSYMKCATGEISCCNEVFSSGSQMMKSCVFEKNIDERVKSHSCQDHFVEEHAEENQAEYTLQPDAREYMSNLDGDIAQERLPATEFNALRPDASKCSSNLDGDIAQERLPATEFNGLEDNEESNSVLDASNLQTKNHIRGELDVGTSSSNPKYKTLRDLEKEKGPVEYIEMTFSSKPPSRNEVGRVSDDSPKTDVGDESLSFDCSFLHTNGQCINDFLPFFVTKSEEGQSSKSSLNEENLNFRHESSLGIPCHFQNDGSVLYLLTHAFSPPPVDSVLQWLSEVVQHNCLNDTTGSYKEKILSSSSDPHMKYDTGLQAVGHEYLETPPECNAAFCFNPEISPSSQENSKIIDAKNYSSRGVIVSNEPQGAVIGVKENIDANNWQDISQISGPDEKSNLTPLSQIGFRDPASIGRGQQLTWISIEVQAESRGDLRSDPQFDAVNIISLAIQEDISSTFEVYVLMRGDNEEPSGRNVNGVFDCKFVIVREEQHLLDHFVKIISSFDPDILMGWEIQGGSLGFLTERAARLGIGLLKNISRAPQRETKYVVKDSGNSKSCDVPSEPSKADTVLEDSIIEDEWGYTHASGIHVGGRIVLNVWRLMRAEVKLNMYTIEAVAEEVLKRKIPSIPCRILNSWFSSGPRRARYRCIEYVIERAKLNIQIMNQLDMINRTSELARVFGIDFFSVLSRGSQFRVESMLLRLAHSQNYLAISPGNQQVALQPAMECLPLVMEPESGFYVDPVVVLDFQSLYPSMIIAYNLCFSTCLGKVFPSKVNVLGVSSYSPKPQLLKDLKQKILLTPNGVMYVSSEVRKGVLPRLLDEILSTRIMIKQTMKKSLPSQQVLQRILNARQLALKLIANVTYGYTAAGFSGRMPCAELADSIVQCGRRTLETAISFVNGHDKWKAKVIYGDTDSMFVLLKGRSVEEAFRIGNEIASSITAMNPNPVTLKMEKVYHPCFLLTKKRYVGYSYESPDQNKPTFDAKGIETVRRDTCPVVAKIMEQSIRLVFEHQDIDKVKSYLHRQWTRIISGKVSLQDFIFAKEVRLGSYSVGASSLPPSAIVATKAMRLDPRAEPRYGERIPYVVIHGEPGSRLIDMVVDPYDLLEIDSPYRLNDLYYINKQIIPALQRVFGLVGADLNRWFSEMPRPVRLTLAKHHPSVSRSGSLHEHDDKSLGLSKKALSKKGRIDTYYASKHCTLCSELVQSSSDYLCDQCSKKESLVVTVVVGRTSKLEREIQHLADVCRHCGGGDWIVESGVKCTSLACPVFFERRKVQKELKALSSFATEAGYYPSCNAEWF